MALRVMSNVLFRFHLNSHRRNSPKSSYIHCNWRKLHCDWSIIKGTLWGRAICDFACILIPTRRIFLKIHIWETTHTCCKHCKCLGGRDAAPNALEVPHNYNRTLDDYDCYMLIAASVETLGTYRNKIVCGDACLKAYTRVSGCSLLV
jgi:hypothetical protein